jgi:hypothetical protein
VHAATHGGGNEVSRTKIAVRTGEAERRDRTQHGIPACPFERPSVSIESGDRGSAARGEDHNVGRAAKFPKQVRCLTLADIESDASFIDVVGGEEQAGPRTTEASLKGRLPTHRITVWRFDLDDVGTEIAQQPGTVGA